MANTKDSAGNVFSRERIQAAADGIRRRVLEHTIASNGGYLSQACSSAEILASLYLSVINLGPSAGPPVPPPFPGVPGGARGRGLSGGAYNGAPDPDRDRFLLSPAHYALVLYAALIETGRMAAEGLSQFNADGSTVEMIGAEHSPGFEMMGGSLAQTLSQAGGIALARRMKGEKGRTWVFLSDGEFQEGQTWEALQSLFHYHLDTIGVYVDVNGQQCDGKTCAVMNLEPLESRITAFGGRVVKADGHDIDALARAGAYVPDGRPLFALCYTDPCRGVPILAERAPKLHYLRFASPEERERYREFLKSGFGKGV